MTELPWVEQQIAKFVAKHGTVPPPYFIIKDSSPYSICWRMGGGESDLEVFFTWWDRQKQSVLDDEPKRVEYFRKWPPPPVWLTWMMDLIWDIDLGDDDPESYDYSDYFTRVEKLGFGTKDDYEREMNGWFDEGGGESKREARVARERRRERKRQAREAKQRRRDKQEKRAKRARRNVLDSESDESTKETDKSSIQDSDIRAPPIGSE